MSEAPIKSDLHPRNRFRSGYDFDALRACCDELVPHVAPNKHGNLSIDFADPSAVKALNGALLSHAYGLGAWDLPPGALCPPIPGRSEHLHHLADLLRDDRSEREGHDGDGVPRGPQVSVLDIGAGASCIYPLIGASEYGWRFVASELEPAAHHWSIKLVNAHPALKGLIACRLQSSAARCFEGVVRPGELFDLSMCNPPFHGSAKEAAEGNQRKRRGLGGRRGRAGRSTKGSRNFGGQGNELWCPGGEVGFVQRMITESAERRELCSWFTTLVSQRAHLPELSRALAVVEPVEVRVLDMAHGQKQSRILAWTFRESDARRVPR